MSENIERSLGRLEGKMNAMHTDISEMKKDVKALNQFEWRVAGGAAALSIVLTALIEVVHLVKGN